MPKAIAMASSACPKLMEDMHNEARVEAVITYDVKYLDAKVKKVATWTMTLTREQ